MNTDKTVQEAAKNWAEAAHGISDKPITLTGNQLRDITEYAFLAGYSLANDRIKELEEKNFELMALDSENGERFENLNYNIDWLYSALKELVDCKNLKDQADGEGVCDDRRAAEIEYEKRKPLAWERARRVIAGHYPTANTRIKELEAIIEGRDKEAVELKAEKDKWFDKYVGADNKVEMQGERIRELETELRALYKEVIALRKINNHD